MYSKVLLVVIVSLYVANAQHDSHSTRAHSVVHQTPVHAHGHHNVHHSAHHAPAVSSQSLHLQHSGGHHAVAHKDHGHHEEHYGHPKYHFEYKVEDPHTGDNKYQKETRDGHKVEGIYHFVQPDGKLRTVKYHADKHSGFNAEVIYSGHAHHVEQPTHYHH